jgi:hypothetical protein
MAGRALGWRQRISAHHRLGAGIIAPTRPRREHAMTSSKPDASPDQQTPPTTARTPLGAPGAQPAPEAPPAAADPPAAPPAAGPPTAADHPAAPPAARPSPGGPPHRPVLRNISEIRTFFRTNETPIFFVGATAFNLLGVDRWVRNLYFITYYDSWDGYHPRVFCPPEIPHEEFTSGEDINNYLLSHPDVREFIRSRVLRPGDRPKISMVFLDETTERVCQESGYDLILPSHALRTRLDSKLTTTRLGEEAGAPSVPNILTEVSSWADLVEQSAAAGLGTDLVLQTAYGDSGKTTFFVASPEDWNRCATRVVGEPVKVMRRINNRAIAVEAVNTRHGTVVGPFMTDLTGHQELTPYRGGWCGNDIFPDVLTPQQRNRATEHVRRLGDRLREEGYRGFFELDVLVDLDSDEVYLGELNPRISGASSMTNVTAGAYADIPLFLFHLLEYLDVDYMIDVDEINDRWLELAARDAWSQLIIKTSDPRVRLIERAPRSGIYRLGEDGTLTYQRMTLDWHYLADPSEVFFLRVYPAGAYLFKGADLGILVGRARMQTDDASLTGECRAFIAGIQSQYVTLPVDEAPEATAPLPPAWVK